MLKMHRSDLCRGNHVSHKDILTLVMYIFMARRNRGNHFVFKKAQIEMYKDFNVCVFYRGWSP